METFLSTLDFGSLGATGILVIVVLLILLGRLVPRRSVDDVRKDKQDWREAAELQAERNAVLSAQIGELLEIGRTSAAVLAAIQRHTEVK